MNLIKWVFFGLLAYIAYGSFFKAKLEKSSGKAAKVASRLQAKVPEESGTQSQEDSGEWVEAVYTQRTTSRARRKNKRSPRSAKSPKSSE